MLIDKLGNIYQRNGTENSEASFLLVPSEVENSPSLKQFRLPKAKMHIYTNAEVTGENITQSDTNPNLYINSEANRLITVDLSSPDTYLSIYNGTNLVYAKSTYDNQIYVVENTEVNGDSVITSGMYDVNISI